MPGHDSNRAGSRRSRERILRPDVRHEASIGSVLSRQAASLLGHPASSDLRHVAGPVSGQQCPRLGLESGSLMLDLCPESGFRVSACHLSISHVAVRDPLFKSVSRELSVGRAFVGAEIAWLWVLGFLDPIANALRLAPSRGWKSGEGSSTRLAARRHGGQAPIPYDWALMLSTIADSELFGQYSLTGFDEMFAAPGPGPPALRRPARSARRAGGRGAGEPRPGGRPDRCGIRGSPSPSTAASRGSSGSSRSTRSRGSSPPTSGNGSSAGLQQRVRALNLFIHDVYHDRLILKDRVVPPELVLGASGYRRECVGLRVPAGHLHPHLRHRPDPRRRRRVPGPGGQLPDPLGRELRAEEPAGDEAGLPRSSSSSTTSARSTTTRPNLLAVLRHIAPAGCDDPTVVVLTPGVYNSAYYEHSFLARQMGVELVEGRDLFLDDGQVFMRTTRGPAAGRRDLPPRRRRLPRPADLPPRQPARRRRPDGGLPGGQRRAGQRASAPASPTTRGSIRSSPTSSATT